MGRNRLLFLFLATFFSFYSSPSTATTYWVSKTGVDDAYHGTSSAPFKTILYGYSKLKPGDTLIVRAGVYSEYKPKYGLLFNSNKTPTSTAKITIKSETPGGAVIDLLNKTDAGSGIWLSGKYHVIEGFKIRNATNGIVLYGTNNIIRRNEIYNNGNGGDPASIYGQSGIYSDSYASDNVYDSNYVHHNGRIKYNISLDHGFYLTGDRQVVMNNIVTYNSGFGIKVAGYKTSSDVNNSASNVKVYNNVSAYNGYSGGLVYRKIAGVEFRNNIFYKNKGNGITLNSVTGSGLVLSNNSFYGNTLSPRVRFIDTVTSLLSELSYFTSNPLFVNETSNYRLQSSSLLINKGWNSSAVVKTDFSGLVLRPQGGAVDVGAFER